MFRRWTLFTPCVVLLAFGCARPPEPAPVPGLRPGDTVRPEVSVTPKGFGTSDAKLWVGALLVGERPNGETYYVKDAEVAIERAVIGARVTFFDGDQVLGERLDVSLVHDC